MLQNTTFTYDTAGNRDTMTVDSQVTDYTYNERDQLTGVTYPGGLSDEYEYDPRGNLETIQHFDNSTPTGTTTYGYDARDRLISADLPVGADTTYAYDYAGHRIKQTVGTQTTNYLWDELSPYGDVLAEYDSSNAVQVRYTLAGGQLISQTRGSDTSYYLADGQHSIRALADEQGIITDTYNYTAFGEIYAQSGSTPNNYLYTGQQYDTATQLYSLRARYYDPSEGRFLTQDTYPYNYQNPIELNRYVYGANNPTTYYDPTGHFFEFASLNFQAVAKRGVMGAAGGGLFGGLAFTFFYILAITNTCGSDLKEWAVSLSPEEVLGEYALAVAAGAAIGGAIGATGVVFPVGGKVFAAAFGLYGFKKSVEDIQENGANLCNVGAGLASLAGVAGGAFGGGATVRLPKPGSTITINYNGTGTLGGLQTAEVLVSESIVTGISGLLGLTAMFSDKQGDDKDDKKQNGDTGNDETKYSSPEEEELLSKYAEDEQAEIRKYMEKWDKGTYENTAKSIVDHTKRHGFKNDYLKYLRKAFNFNKRGAGRNPDFGVRNDGTVSWHRKGGEFLIERGGKIVSYGYNK